MALPWLIPFGVGVAAAILRSAFEDNAAPEYPAAGLKGLYVDDGDGLRLTISGWPSGTYGTLVLHGRTASGGFLKAAHSSDADRDGDFCQGRHIEGESCEFYLPNGAVLGYEKPTVRLSARIVSQDAGLPGPTIVSEDTLTVDVVDRRYSIVSFLRPLIVLFKAVAKADGPFVAEEVRFIRELVTSEFQPSQVEVDELRWLLKEQDVLSVEEAAQAFRYRMPQIDLVDLAKLLRDLCAVDGQANVRETRLVLHILAHAGMSAPELEACASGLGLPDQKRIDECLAILGLSGEPTRDELQRAWRRATKEFHPDRYHGEAMPEAVRAMIAARCVEVNEAYETLSKGLG